MGSGVGPLGTGVQAISGGGCEGVVGVTSITTGVGVASGGTGVAVGTGSPGTGVSVGGGKGVNVAVGCPVMGVDGTVVKVAVGSGIPPLCTTVT